MITTDPSLLISDDDLNFRETLEDVFAPRGFRIFLAGDGEEALHIVRTQEVHLALLDMHMPKLTGLETLRLVKQFKAMLPCILMSAHWDDMLMEQARLSHAFLVLSKTIPLRQITGAVWQALEWTYSWRWRRTRSRLTSAACVAGSAARVAESETRYSRTAGAKIRSGAAARSPRRRTTAFRATARRPGAGPVGSKTRSFATCRHWSIASVQRFWCSRTSASMAWLSDSPASTSTIEV